HPADHPCRRDAPVVGRGARSAARAVAAGRGEPWRNVRAENRLRRRHALAGRSMQPFLIALQFLTSLPVRLSGMPAPQAVGRSLLHYPLVGLLLGLVLWLGSLAIEGAALPLQAALVLAAWVALTGALHLDGLADSADAWL